MLSKFSKCQCPSLKRSVGRPSLDEKSRGKVLDTCGAGPCRMKIIAGDLCSAVVVRRLKRTSVRVYKMRAWLAQL